jgi:hypothetical protein
MILPALKKPLLLCHNQHSKRGLHFLNIYRSKYSGDSHPYVSRPDIQTAFSKFKTKWRKPKIAEI